MPNRTNTSSYHPGAMKRIAGGVTWYLKTSNNNNTSSSSTSTKEGPNPTRKSAPITMELPNADPDFVPAPVVKPFFVNYAAAAAAKPPPPPTSPVVKRPEEVEHWKPKKKAKKNPNNYNYNNNYQPQGTEQGPVAKYSTRWVVDADGFKTKVATISVDGGKTWIPREAAE